MYETDIVPTSDDLILAYEVQVHYTWDPKSVTSVAANCLD